MRYSVLKSYYDLDKTIGTGGFAKVKLATHVLTGEKVAIKIMDKTLLGEDNARVRMELEALKSVSHHHICKLYEIIETQTHFFLVMEYCSGGELFDHIVEKSRLTECEARTFFRQILSAVAYLHKVGFAHRDLKPENILLDKDLNLKLIDFGLCAKPQGGMSSHLLTSCGSPTYAAPELIQGHKYFGSQVDVWSLGVMLYALLCGFLPFDCDTIESLYKKILSGVYEEPIWLTDCSKEIIKSMLQTNPNKRITIDELLSHPWVTLSYFEPVSYSSLNNYKEKDDIVLKALAEYYECDVNEAWSRISKWRYNYDTATYQLLLARRKRGQPLKIVQNIVRFRRRVSKAAEARSRAPLRSPMPLSPSRPSYSYLVSTLNNKVDVGGKENAPVTPTKTPRKRAHSVEIEQDSPIPFKMTPGSARGSNTPTTPNTPGNKILCSIEKRFIQVRNVLTPRKRIIEPITLSAKNLCNVSTTSYTNPSQVLEELKKALSEKGMTCKNKGFSLRGKMFGPDDKKDCKLSFELEICLVKSNENEKAVVGIKRKRLKGDSWRYKRVVEQILKLTNREVV